MQAVKTNRELLQEIKELRLQLQEANELLHAIRSGQVDAIVVENEKGHQLYTLKSADQTYRVFIEKMKEGAVTLNKDEVVLYCNSQFASMVNLPPSRITGHSFSDFVPEEYKDHFRELIENGWKSDSKGEISLRDKDGHLVPFLFSVASLELDEGTALSIILTDLSIQKNVEKQLKIKNEQLEAAKRKVSRLNEGLEEMVKERTRDLLLSREHFKFLADNIPVIVWTTQRDGTVDYFNKRWYDYTGLNFQDSKTRLKEIMHPNDFDASVRSWNAAVEKQEPYEFEYRFKRASDGQYRWHRVNAVPFRDESGEVVAWFGTSIDIEDQKTELEKKDEFIGVASHELKTPLTSLKGYMQLMAEYEARLPENVNHYIKKANDSMNKLQHLINDLLDVSKIQAGKLKFSMGPLNLADIIQSCVESSNHIYPVYTIQSHVEKNIPVIGNAERLEQVLMNLISNAVKYSPANKDIIIRAEKSGNIATVTVIDFGIGLSAENQQKIFERFFRVNDNKFLAAGLGMGLYISSEIIKEHNGSIQVKSELNQGAEFSVTLPVAATPRQEN